MLLSRGILGLVVELSYFHRPGILLYSVLHARERDERCVCECVHELQC